MIPPTQGAALGAQHSIRNKRFLNFVATTTSCAQPQRAGDVRHGGGRGQGA